VRNFKTCYILLLALTLGCSKSPTATPPAAPLPVPLSVHLSLGNPTGARADAATPDNFLMLKDQYALSYNRARATPNWVSWELSADWLGETDRSDDFRPDPALPAGWYRVTTADYTNSGFDRGHVCPSADRTRNAADNSSTFLMTNMIPQAPQLNREPWARFEDYCRTLAKKGYRLYIVAGVYGSGGEGSKGPMASIIGKVAVPSHNYKVVVAIPKGGQAADVSMATPVIALDFPNVVSQVDNKSWGGFVTTARQIERDAGVTLFTNLPEKVRAGLLDQRFDPMGKPL
jgi:endonuclease G